MSFPSRSALALFLVSPAAFAGGDRSLRLSAPLPSVPAGAASAPEFSADLQYLVYLATTTGADLGLFSAGLDGSRVRLDDLPPGRSVASFALEPTSRRVVFLTTDVVGRELYSAPTDGSSPAVRLHAPLVDGHDVTSFLISPDGERVVYRGDVLVNGRFTLTSVPIAGGAELVVNGPLAAAGDVQEGYRISPDASTVVYVADEEVNDEFQLYAAPIAGGGPSRNLGADVAPTAFPLRLTADGARVVYRGFSSVGEVLSVPLDAATAPVLLTDGPTLNLSDFLTTPDSARVVIWSVFGAVYVAPTDGSAPLTTLADLHVSGSLITDVALSADGAVVVFRGDLLNDEVFQLFAVPVDGSAPAYLLNPTLAAGEDVESGFQLTPDGSAVVFEVAGRLYVRALDALATPRLLDTGLGAGDLAPALGSDSARVFYLRQFPAGVRLLSARLDGSTAPFAIGSGWTSVTSVRPRPDAAVVAYTADQEQSGDVELFVAPSATPGGGARISAEPSVNVLAGEVFSHQPAPGDRVLFTARQESPNYVGLYSVRAAGGGLRYLSGRSAPVPVLPQGRVAVGAGYAVFQGARAAEGAYEPAGLYAVALDGRSEPIALHGAPAADAAVLDFVLSPDGALVFFRGDLAGDGELHLYRAPIDGSAPALQLTAGALDGRDIEGDYRAAPGGVVVYRSFFDGLYTADGSGPPTRLHGALASGESVQRFELTPDGTRALYLADLGANRINSELYSVPLDASAAPVKLSGVLVDTELADEFHLTPNGVHVVFLEWHTSGVGFHLYRAPVDGSAALVRLDTSAASVQRGFAIDPSGTRVLYRVDPSIAAPTDLYGVPLDGSAAPVRLNDVNGVDVSPLTSPTSTLPGFQFSADGARVVYLQGTQLFAVPSDRSAPPLLLNEPASPSAGFLLDPSGTLVAYLGDAPDPVLGSVYVVPIDRTREPLLVGPSANAGGDARDDLSFTADGSALFFRFARADGLHEELFAALLARQARSAPPPRTR